LSYAGALAPNEAQRILRAVLVPFKRRPSLPIRHTWPSLPTLWSSVCEDDSGCFPLASRQVERQATIGHARERSTQGTGTNQPEESRRRTDGRREPQPANEADTPDRTRRLVRDPVNQVDGNGVGVVVDSGPCT